VDKLEEAEQQKLL